MQAHRGVQVFGDGAGGKAANLVECAAPHHGATAAEEGGVPVVLAALDDAEEERLLGPHRATRAAPAVLKRIEVVEVLRRLHEAHLRVREIAQRLGQKVAPRCVIGIEDRDQLAAAVGQRMVQVARLGVLVVGARQVFAAKLPGQRAHLRAAPVVEQPGFVRVVHRPRGEQRLAHQLDRFVVGRHEYVDAQARGRRRRRAVGEAPAHEYVQQRGAEAEHFGPVHQPREEGCGRVEGAQAPDQVPDADDDEGPNQEAAGQFERGERDVVFHGSAEDRIAACTDFGRLRANSITQAGSVSTLRLHARLGCALRHVCTAG